MSVGPSSSKRLFSFFDECDIMGHTKNKRKVEKTMRIKEYLTQHKILADGAFGTYYTSLVKDEHRIAELANWLDSKRVKTIHKEYIQAGARLIRTNTFSVGRNSLHITQEEQADLIGMAWDLACQAVEESGKEVFIAADIGPLTEEPFNTEEEVQSEYEEIVDAFLEKGADIFLFETFSDLRFLSHMAAYIKQKKKDAFVWVEFSLNRYGYTTAGLGAPRLLSTLEKEDGIDAIGFNCGIGSGHMLSILRGLELPEDKIITAFPNSGYPETIQNRMSYLENQSYFTSKLKEISGLGVQILGGCCGTTPQFIEEAAQKINLGYEPFEKMRIPSSGKVVARKERKNPFLEKLYRGEKVIAVEVDPPFDARIERFMECAHVLNHVGVDMLTIADSPMGRSRADSILMSVKVGNEVGIPVMPHLACRDRNAISIRASILGGYLNGIRNLLLVTGDPVPFHDRGEIKGVYDFNSTTMMNFIREMNEEHFKQEPIVYGGALNQGRANFQSEIGRMEKKIEAGASYFLTQPIFSIEDIEKIKQVKEQIDTKILCGIMPLVSYNNASFIRNEITGIHVPQWVVDRFSSDMTREEGEQAGIAIAREVIQKLKPIADGFYFMLPFNRVHLVEPCLEGILR